MKFTVVQSLGVHVHQAAPDTLEPAVVGREVTMKALEEAGAPLFETRQEAENWIRDPNRPAGSIREVSGLHVYVPGGHKHLRLVL